ncbi:LytR/AlgR family response regulator transcription factor [Terriglobus sp. RCC_193]|uniref:LytR/AlgR family response regulator transcription factor n=1 Tax=Terriglobus sp. RCC_193 TaxID=3239218 RepID=UPI0035231EA5
MTIRALVIDDEPLVRSSILKVLRDDKDIEVIHECEDGISALEVINRESPDLIFLDVQMPGLTGLQVMESLEGAKVPITVFVTAHKDYAIEAFETNAVDYILKPFGKDRLERAIARAKMRFASSLDSNYAVQLIQALASVQKQQQYQERIAVPVNGRILLIDTKDIEWIEADRNSVRLHLGTLVYELRNTLTNIESKLNPKQFTRIHRSTLVNVSKIREIHPWFNGYHKVIMRSGQELSMSRHQSESARMLLGGLNQ